MRVEEKMGGGQEIEWCYGADDQLFVVQTRPMPEVAKHALRRRRPGAVMVTGVGASPGQATGSARIVQSADDIERFEAGDILVVSAATPDWLPLLNRAVGVVSDRGGITGHLSVTCRGLGIPCVVGTRTATVTIRDGDVVAVDGTTGIVRAPASRLAIASESL
jgi:pyruvate,water dikinase